MQTVAVLFVPPAPSAASAEPLIVGGIGILERQIRQVRRAGVVRTIVVGQRHWGDRVAADIGHVADAGGLPRLLDGVDRVLTIAPGAVLDERIVAATVAGPAPAVAVWPTRTGHAGTERIDAVTVAAGIALYPAALVRDVAARLGDWDLPSTLLRAALGEPGLTRVDLAALPAYAPERRREVPLVWALPTDADGARAVTATIVAAAQKGCLDWPARYLHAPIEDAVVRLLLPTAVTPNMVTLANAAVALVAVVAFAGGWLWTGLILALVCGPLDGVDGKLARSRIEFSRLGELEHVLDKVAEYGWFAAVAAHFAHALGHDGPWAVAALLIGFALAESLQGEFFRRFTGVQLDDAGRFERGFRVVAARRNTLLWTWLPFAAAGAWYEGFFTLSLYTLATFFVMQVRFFVRLGEYGRNRSSVIDRNFAESAYELFAKPANRRGTANV